MKGVLQDSFTFGNSEIQFASGAIQLDQYLAMLMIEY